MTPAMARRAARRASRPGACASELPTQNTTSKGSKPCVPRSSQRHWRTSTRAPFAAASARVRSTMPALASVAVTSNPRWARPTASGPVPAAQSSTRAPGATPSMYGRNIPELPAGVVSASGTIQS